MSVERHNAEVTQGHFSQVLWMSLKEILCKCRSYFLFFPYMFVYIAICLSIVNIDYNNKALLKTTISIIEKHY